MQMSGAIFALPGEIAEDLPIGTPVDSPELLRPPSQERNSTVASPNAAANEDQSMLPSAVPDSAELISPATPTQKLSLPGGGIPPSPSSRSLMLAESMATGSPVKSHSAARLARRDSVSAASLAPSFNQSLDLTPLDDGMH